MCFFIVNVLLWHQTYLLLIVLEILLYKTDYLGIINQIEYHADEFETIKDYKDALKEIKKIKEDLLCLVNKDEELKIKFLELYETNKFLLDNPNELLKKIKNISDKEEIKRILKKG